MMRPLSIAASLALVLAATAVTAQTTGAPPAGTPVATPAPAIAAAASPAPAETAAAPAATPAAPAPVTALTGDAARGKGLSYTCRGCHGVTGYKNAYPSYHVPKLGGQSEVYLRNALLQYRGGKRKHPTMQAQAESFAEQDLADIAAYLASIK